MYRPGSLALSICHHLLSLSPIADALSEPHLIKTPPLPPMQIQTGRKTVGSSKPPVCVAACACVVCLRRVLGSCRMHDSRWRRAKLTPPRLWPRPESARFVHVVGRRAVVSRSRCEQPQGARTAKMDHACVDIFLATTVKLNKVNMGTLDYTHPHDWSRRQSAPR